MATLAEIFPDIKEECYLDDKGVYLDGEKVAISNSRNSAYTRRTGTETIEKVDHGGLHNVELPLRLVASVPDGKASSVRQAVIAALLECNLQVTSVTLDKKLIAEEELINEEELTKFHNVVLIMVDYTENNKQNFGVNCDIDLC